MASNYIVCKVADCNYHSASNFCLNPLTFINQRGLCGYVYDRHGRINNNYNCPQHFIGRKLFFGQKNKQEERRELDLLNQENGNDGGKV